MYLARRGIEVLKLQFANCTAVHSVGEIATELLYIEVVGTLPYLFIRREANAYLPVLDFGVLNEVLTGRHYLGNTGLVISPKQCLTVGYNNVLSCIMLYFWVLGGFECDVLCLVEDYIFAVVVLHNAWLHMLTTCIGRCIHVGNKTYRRFALCISRECRHDIPVAIKCYLL